MPHVVVTIQKNFLRSGNLEFKIAYTWISLIISIYFQGFLLFKRKKIFSQMLSR